MKRFYSNIVLTLPTFEFDEGDVELIAVAAIEASICISMPSCDEDKLSKELFFLIHVQVLNIV